MRIGFLISSLGTNQLAYYLLNQGNKFYKAGGLGTDLIVFYQNIVKPWAVPVFPLMNISEVYNFSGCGIATNIETAAKLAHSPGPSSRYFYLWDLEWLRDPIRPFEESLAIYTDPRMEFIARSDFHAKEFERCWNRPVKAVVENCDLVSMISVVGSPKRKGI